MKYFLHDSNAFSDEKVTLLYLKFGFEAIGLFFCILEKLALQEQPINEIVLKSQLNIKKRLEKQLNFMYKIDILSLRNGDVFSKNILKFSEKYQIKKEKTRKRVSEWRDKQDDTENVTRYKRVRNTPKDKISKDKISKVNNKESDVLIFTYEKFISLFNEITKRNFKGDSKSEHQFNARIKKYNEAEFGIAIRNAHKDEYLRQKPKYLTPEYISRENQIEKWLNVIEGEKPKEETRKKTIYDINPDIKKDPNRMKFK